MGGLGTRTSTREGAGTVKMSGKLWCSSETLALFDPNPVQQMGSISFLMFDILSFIAQNSERGH